MNKEKKNILEMKVEIPSGSSNKYEFDYLKNEWKLDRVLYGSTFYPAEYGFIENTLDHDGDPLDVLCLTSFSTFPGCVIPIRVIGVLKMIDQGEEDHKIIAVPSKKVDPRFSHVNSIREIGHKSEEIINFFSNYKKLEKKEVKIEGFQGENEALEIIENCRLMFSNYIKKIKKID